MISTWPLKDLVIESERQRAGDSPSMAPAAIGALADSIEARGLMQPLVVEVKGEGGLADPRLVYLRAGERRSKAISLLYAQGTTIRFGSEPLPLGMVPIVRYDELSPLEAFLIELEENEKREPLTLAEKARAYARLHELLAPKATSPRQAMVDTIAAFKRIDPADVDPKRGDLGEAQKLVIIGQHLADPDVARAKTTREAVKIISRKMRKEEDGRAPVGKDTQGLLGDAIEILTTLPDASFHGIIADPPYGVGITQLSYQSSSEQEYDDSYESWLVLIPALFSQLQRVLKADAHGYLFCDLSRFFELSAFASSAGFECYPKPLIWDRSPDGRLTTPEKWPRRCYECILYFRRGNRPLLEVKGDVIRFPADREQGNYHGAKKPVELVVDFINRSFRKGEAIIDPFAGSFAVARAGKRTGISVTSIEKDPSYFALGQRLLEEDGGTF